jgi:hypothetical protein
MQGPDCRVGKPAPHVCAASVIDVIVAVMAFAARAAVTLVAEWRIATAFAVRRAGGLTVAYALLVFNGGV